MDTSFIPEHLSEASYKADFKVRKEAARAWKKIVRYVNAHDGELKQISSNAGHMPLHGLYVKGKDVGIPKMLVVFSPGKRLNGAYFHDPVRGHVIHISGADTEDLAFAVHDPRYQNVFLHEYIHYLDRLRHKGKTLSTKAMRQTKPNVYVRSHRDDPHEFNAIFQEVAHAIETSLFQRYELDDLADKVRVFKSFGAFHKYVLGNSRAFDMERDIKGTKWERKWAKRMHDLYRELKAKVHRTLKR